MCASNEAKEEVGDGLKELNCHSARKYARKRSRTGR